MSVKTLRTFRGLFTDNAIAKVEIPIIQRDYAQGRMSAHEVRNQFLKDLHKVLSLPDSAPEHSLNLDFIYGSMEGSAFCPLDGQQRLTTLFLLHWYLACKDGRSREFQELLRKDRRSRFTYKVRRSSEEFCDALVGWALDLKRLLPDDKNHDGSLRNNALSKTIADYSWFFLSWRLDPTIQSALTMLDAIHNSFKDTEGLYERLVQIEQPYITFQFLNLRDFGLSDDLYIKMNARGKLLTPFETFKARLEPWIGENCPGDERELKGRSVSLRDYFSHRVDTTWSDLFWGFRDKQTHLFDLQFMNFIRGMALVMNPQSRGDASPDTVNRALDELSDFSVELVFYKYQDNGCLTPEFVRTVITVLDCLSGMTGGSAKNYLKDPGYYDEIGILTHVLRGVKRGVVQSEWIQFYGYCAYLAENAPALNPETFYDWMRVVSNLATNSIYSHTDEFRRAIVGIHDLLYAVRACAITDYVADQAQPVSGFNRQQVQEEQLKAQLMRRNHSWHPHIVAAEKHGYFKGQIEFLLKFSGVLDRWIAMGRRCDWNDDGDELYRQKFTTYFEKALAIFGNTGLRSFDRFLWERALLSVGNYLLNAGANLSFLTDGDRDASWKRLLRGSEQSGDEPEAKREMVKKLLDDVDCGDVERSLEMVVKRFLLDGSPAPGEEWRRKIVQCPDAIEFCRERRIRMLPGGYICLLTKSRMSSYHADLPTFHLKVCILDRKVSNGELKPFSTVKYEPVATETETDKPHVVLHSIEQNLALRIVYVYESGCYKLDLSHGNGAFANPFRALLIERLAFEPGAEGVLSRQVCETQIETTIDQLASNLAEAICNDATRPPSLESGM